MSRQLLTIYGTEFDELDEEQAKLGPQKKPTAIQDQIATDEHGKRRFHGAFTGGFSAGYWNTVGSKEGWKPNDFRSTRDQRSNFNQLKAEDIMDAEDLGEHGIAARKIRQTSTFARDLGAGKRRMAWEHDETASSSLVEALAGIVKPTKNSIGSLMLHKMGWREGRGVGLATVKQASGSSKEADFDRQQAAKVAPGYDLSLEDELVVQLVPCTGTQGLGYTGLKPTNVLDEKWGLMEASLKADNLKRKSKGIRGQAFGVGAFEEEDESVYTQFDLSQYDFALDGPGGSQEPSAQAVDFTFEEMPKRQNARKFFNAPRLPNSWKPDHKSIPIDVNKLPESLRNAMNNLTVEQRARLVIIVTLDIVAQFSDFSVKTEYNLLMKQRVAIEKREREGVDGIFDLTRKIGKLKDMNRVEFPDEPMKQRRFKEFLTYVRRGIPWPKPSDMSVWEWESEKKDFESKLTPTERALLPEVRSRAEPLAKSNLSLPIKELMANKFTAETGSGGHIGRQDEDKLAAVKMNMFGDRTRSLFEWYPDNLLAKRFNVPHPYPGATFSGCPHLQKTHKPATLVDLGLPSTAGELIMRKHEPEKPNVEEEADQLKPEIEEEKPAIQQPVSIFDAIFGDLDATSNDSSDDEDEGEKIESIEPTSTNNKEELEHNEKESEQKSQEKIFSVLDLYNDEEYGPAPPPDQPECIDGLTGFSVLRYLQEELKERKRHKKKDDERKNKKKHKKEKKHSKKSKKEKKSKRDKKNKKKHHHQEAASDSTETIDSDSSVQSASPTRNGGPPVISIE